MSKVMISLSGISRHYKVGTETVKALRNVDLDIKSNEYVALMGPSGSGKSTLMNILGCLDRPTRGDYRISGRSTRELGDDELAALRRHHFGFIFQRYHLLPHLDALAADGLRFTQAYAACPVCSPTRCRAILVARWIW